MTKNKDSGNDKIRAEDRGPAREENFDTRKDKGFRDLLRRYIALRVAYKNQNSGWEGF